MKNLQLDYLDLYLMHWPQAQKKGVPIPELTDEEKYGYSEKGIAETWKVQYYGMVFVVWLYIEGVMHQLKKSPYLKVIFH